MNCVLWMDMRGEPDLINQFKGLVNISGMDVLKVLELDSVDRRYAIRSAARIPPRICYSSAITFLRSMPKLYKFLNVLDYLNLRLTGRVRATYDSILTSWVTDNRDPDNIHYDPGLVRSSGVDGDKFPEIVPCTAVLGTLKADVAEDWVCRQRQGGRRRNR